MPGVEVGLHRVVVPMIEVEVNLSDTCHVRDTKNQVLKWIENHGNIFSNFGISHFLGVHAQVSCVVSIHQAIITVEYWMNILHQEIDTDKLMEPVVLPDMGIWHPFLGRRT